MWVSTVVRPIYRDYPGNMYSIMAHLAMQPLILILLYWLSYKIDHILYILLGLSPLLIPIGSSEQVSPYNFPHSLSFIFRMSTNLSCHTGN